MSLILFRNHGDQGASLIVVSKPRLLFSPVSQKKPSDSVCNTSFTLFTRCAMNTIELCLISQTQRQKKGQNLVVLHRPVESTAEKRSFISVCFRPKADSYAGFATFPCSLMASTKLEAI